MLKIVIKFMIFDIECHPRKKDHTGCGSAALIMFTPSRKGINVGVPHPVTV